jgi:hypothetical protein
MEKNKSARVFFAGTYCENPSVPGLIPDFGVGESKGVA